MTISTLTITPKEPAPALALVDGTPDTPEMDKLIEVILATKRCHNSTGELNFVAWLYKYLEELKVTTLPLAEGAISVEVGTGGKTMFSCHLDTVHQATECDGSLQKVFYDPAFGHIFCGDKTTTCLGADDGAGIYILLKMIQAQVKGTYVFHRGEEKGGISARAILAKHPEFLKKFNACIAFDRPNNDEVIITQGGSPCASPEYGRELAAALSKEGMKYEISTRGVFTDSKVYRDIIPECINIGVGYSNQHSNQEYQDWGHLLSLTKVAIGIDWDSIKPKRVPTPAPAYVAPKTHNNGGYKGFYDDWKGDPFKPAKSKKSEKGVYVPPKSAAMLEDTLDIDLENMTYQDLVEYVGDDELTTAIMKMQVELHAERGRVARLQMLLGM